MARTYPTDRGFQSHGALGYEPYLSYDEYHQCEGLGYVPQLVSVSHAM